MKSTYYLVGISWDHKPIPDKLPRIINLSENVQDISEDYNLFDLFTYERKILLSTIWNLSLDELRNCLLKAKECSSICLVIDFTLQNLEQVSLRYYSKRLLQAFQYICDFFQDKPITLSWGNEITIEQRQAILKTCREMIVGVGHEVSHSDE